MEQEMVGPLSTALRGATAISSREHHERDGRQGRRCLRGKIAPA
jgi:hypothetical protein